MAKIVQVLTRQGEEYSDTVANSLVRDLDGIVQKLNSTYQQELKEEVGHGPISELEETVEILQCLISEIATRNSSIRCALKVSINEEPDEGNLQVRFCEGHASPYTNFSKTLYLLN